MTLDSLPMENYPGWARELAERYLSGASSFFVIHGNINDWVPLRETGKTSFLSLTSFLKTAIFGTRNTIIQFDPGTGITVNAESSGEFYKSVAALDTASGSTFARALPRTSAEALFVIDRFVRSRLMGGEKKASVAIVINFAHMVAPRAELQYMANEDFRILITLLAWASDPDFGRSDITIVLVSPNIRDVSEAIVNNPFTSKIEIQLPSEAERIEYIRQSPLAGNFSEITPDELGRQTNALSRVDIEVILRESQREKTVSSNFVAKKKKELIEKSCLGLLEFLEPKTSLDDIYGHATVKKRIREDVSLIQQGHWDALPMGYLISGPVGTGKTYLSMCAISELGIPCVQLLNFRSKWVGATEGNLEKILTTLKALGPVGVIIDEADAFMGSRSSDGDSGTSNRIFAQFASQMGDTKNRGKILWFLLTCRPDLLPVDIKRQGRVEIHIPLFYPEDAAEKAQLFIAMSNKQKWPVAVEDLDAQWFEQMKLSGADIESIIVSARRKSILDGSARSKRQYVEEAMMNFIPTTNTTAVLHQELAAVIECTDRTFLPERYKGADRQTLFKEFNRLTTVLGE